MRPLLLLLALSILAPLWGTGPAAAAPDDLRQRVRALVELPSAVDRAHQQMAGVNFGPWSLDERCCSRHFLWSCVDNVHYWYTVSFPGASSELAAALRGLHTKSTDVHRSLAPLRRWVADLPQLSDRFVAVANQAQIALRAGRLDAGARSAMHRDVTALLTELRASTGRLTSARQQVAAYEIALQQALGQVQGSKGRLQSRADGELSSIGSFIDQRPCGRKDARQQLGRFRDQFRGAADSLGRSMTTLAGEVGRSTTALGLLSGKMDVWAGAFTPVEQALGRADDQRLLTVLRRIDLTVGLREWRAMAEEVRRSVPRDWMTRQVPGSPPLAKAKAKVFDGVITLDPDAWQPIYLGVPQSDTTHVVAFEPLGTPQPTAAGRIPRHVIHPEWIADRWRTVLRVAGPAGASGPLRVRVVVYGIYFAPRVGDVTTTVQPGGWDGLLDLGRSDAERAFAVTLIPLEPAKGSTYFDHTVQPEFDGSAWNTIVRVASPGDMTGPSRIRVLAFEVPTTALAHTVESREAGGAEGRTAVGPARHDRAYVAGIEPLEAPRGTTYIGRWALQPTYDRRHGWRTVFSLTPPAELQAALRVRTKVFFID